MGLCIDPSKEEALGLADKAKRSLGVGVTGLSEREAGHREKHKRKIIAGFQEFSPEMLAHVLPGFGRPHEGFHPAEQQAVLISADTLREVTKKIVRGCEYCFAERYIEQPYELEVHFPNGEGIEEMDAVLSTGTTETLGPGLVIKRTAAREDEKSVLYGFRIWGTLRVYATIVPPEAAG
jgi:hypothetical protein